MPLFGDLGGMTANPVGVDVAWKYVATMKSKWSAVQRAKWCTGRMTGIVILVDEDTAVSSSSICAT